MVLFHIGLIISCFSTPAPEGRRQPLSRGMRARPPISRAWHFLLRACGWGTRMKDVYCRPASRSACGAPFQAKSSKGYGKKQPPGESWRLQGRIRIWPAGKTVQ
jgi:hypothetical protein